MDYKKYSIYPPWWSLYSILYSEELWIPLKNNNTKQYIPKAKFDSCSKDINYECFTENGLNKPIFPFVKFLGNSFFDGMEKQIILSKKTNAKIINLVKKKKFDQAIGAGKLYRKQLLHINEYIRSYKVKLILSNKQKSTIEKWAKIATIVYNNCVDKYNKANGKITLNFTKLKKEVIFSIPALLRKNCPYNIMSYEVKVFCSNVKSCLTQMKQNNITHYKLKHKNTKESQTISIEKQNINKNGFYTQSMGKVNHNDKSFSFSNIACDCKLTLNKKNGEYHLFIPQYIKGEQLNNRDPIVSLDPGEKCFLTFYGMDHAGMIGNDIRKKILGIEEQIKYIQRKMNKNKKKRKSLLKALRRKYRKIQGFVKELHHKSALYLCKNYNIILIPRFETQNMVSDKKKCIEKIKENKRNIKNNSQSNAELRNNLKRYKRVTRLNSRVKFVLNNLSHYKFKQHLLAKGKEYGCLIVEVGEEYTSKCCGKCGHISDQYKNRIKKCPMCNLEIDRDYNGSRNILIKNLLEIKG